MRNGISLGGALWIIIGAVVALQHGHSINDVSTLLSFVLALFLWPLVLLGVDLHLSLGT